MIYLILNFVIMVIYILVSVAFVTLLERKVLGYIQMRSGPNKVGYLGLVQPASDAVKLFTKELVSSNVMNFNMFIFSPVLMLVLMLSNWMIYPLVFKYLDFTFSLLFFLCIISMGVYVLLGCGWASNSKFSLLGALRGVVQTISYEVSLAIVLLSLILLTGSFSLDGFFLYQRVVMFVIVLFPLFLIWVMIILAETNRSPFDLSEGESELVSGFNVEYSSGVFAMLFMGEYGMILFMSFLMSLMFFGSSFFSYIIFIFCVFFIIWVRGTVARYRYDSLMGLAWKVFLPVGLMYLLGCVGMSIMFSGDILI